MDVNRKPEFYTTKDLEEIEKKHKRRVRYSWIGGILAATLVCKYSYDQGGVSNLHSTFNASQGTEITQAYNPEHPNTDLKDNLAKNTFLTMKEGEQFMYKGKRATLLSIEGNDERPVGPTLYFVVGKELKRVNTNTLSSKATIDDAFK